MQKPCVVVVRRKCQPHEYSCRQIVYTRQSNFNLSPSICQHTVRQNWQMLFLPSHLNRSLRFMRFFGGIGHIWPSILPATSATSPCKGRKSKKQITRSWLMVKEQTLREEVRQTQSSEKPLQMQPMYLWQEGTLRNQKTRLCLMSEALQMQPMPLFIFGKKALWGIRITGCV